MITKRERELKAKGYTYDCGAPTHDSALMIAESLRRAGYYATVQTEWHNGIPDYSVWSKKKT